MRKIDAKAFAKVTKSIAKVMFSKKIRILLSVIYVGIILYITVFSRTPGSERIFKGLFWEYRNGMWNNIFLNIVLFMPLGFLSGSKKGILFGFLLSVAVEIIQYICLLGYCEIDDVLNNTVGTVIGYAI